MPKGFVEMCAHDPAGCLSCRKERKRDREKIYHENKKEERNRKNKQRYVERYKDDPQYKARVRETSKKHYRENRESILLRGRELKDSNPARRAEIAAKNHGRAWAEGQVDEANRMLRKHLVCDNEGCAWPFHVSHRERTIDHCHVTGKVRGILCGLCNKALGLMKDNREILLGAIAYLDKHAPKED